MIVATFSFLVKLVTGQRIYDTSSGLKIINRSVFKPLTSWRFVDLHAEAIVYLMRLGYKVGECWRSALSCSCSFTF